MGLHRDPSHYTSNPVEIHIRRLIWYQICFLDLRTCEATGPRPQIRREEFDTKFPLNIDDVDLESGLPITQDKPYFTDMTIARMRFECYEMHRLLWIERPKLDSKKITLTALLSKIQKFCQAMEKTYLPLLNKTQPLHVLAMEIYGILSCRLYIMVLQKFLSTAGRLMPERLRQMAMSTAILTMEHSMTIEQTPALADWTWYVGALHQYHTALLLLSEMYAKVRDPGIERRAWRCLDFVFDLPAGATSGEKSRMIFEELVDRTQTYTEMRRVRAPKQMEQPGPRVVSYQYQVQEVEREHKRRSASATSGGESSDFGASTSSSPSQGHPQISAQQMGNLDQIAAGGFNFATNPYANTTTADTGVPIPSTSPEMQSFNFAMSSQPQQQQTGGQQATGIIPGTSPSGQGSDSSSNPSAAPPLGTGASPMDAMPDIDWVSSYALFNILGNG